MTSIHNLSPTVKALLSTRIKIRRAKKHFNDLHREVGAFIARKPYKIIVDEDSEPAVKIYKLKILKEVPLRWSGIIGDIIHNSRAALDCLATGLVIFKSNGHVSDNIIGETYFPIRWDSDGLSNAKAKAFFQRVGPTAEKLVRRLQPYRGGLDEALWRLERLDIIDKHRQIIPVGANLAKINLPDRSPVAHTAKLTFPLKDGDELFRVAFFEPHFDAHAHFVFGIVFGEGQIFDREPVLPTLKQLIDFVERIADVFEKYAFR